MGVDFYFYPSKSYHCISSSHMWVPQILFLYSVCEGTPVPLGPEGLERAAGLRQPHGTSAQEEVGRETGRLRHCGASK